MYKYQSKDLERQEANRLANQGKSKMLLCHLYKVIQFNKSLNPHFN